MGDDRYIQKYPPIKTRHPRARPERNEAIVRALIVEEMTMEQVGELFNISKQRVQQIADRAGIRMHHSPGMSKQRILKQQVEIRRLARLEHYQKGVEMVRAGMSIPQAAARCQIHYGTLYKYVKLAGVPLGYDHRTRITKEQRAVAEQHLIEGWDVSVLSWHLGIGAPTLVRIRRKLAAENKLIPKQEHRPSLETEVEKLAHEFGLIIDNDVDAFQEWRKNNQ